MIRFECDYLEGVCPEILKNLEETNMKQLSGYGTDIYCDSARERIKQVCKCPDAEVQFLIGGTQTNMIVISSILKSYQGVLTPQSGHINVMEAGAIEATGHKVLVVETEDGKIKANQVKEICECYHNDEHNQHKVQPGMVYISFPTENGLIYTKKELKELYKVCKEYHIPLYIDGARLGYGLMAENCDVEISDIAKNCDVFYIGGTKIGALFGEAVVITNEKFKEDFRYYIKQRGALLAKGRFLGIQFNTLFQNDLYWKISKHAINLAMKIKKAFEESGYKFLFESNTNQQFVIIPNEVLSKLSEKYTFYFWQEIDKENSAVRICTSWATKEEDVNELIQDIKKYKII